MGGHRDASESVEPVLRLEGLTKRFGSVTANDSIDLTVGRQEIHAIVGENGAGKSTILDVLCFALYGKPFRKIKKNQF